MKGGSLNEIWDPVEDGRTEFEEALTAPDRDRRLRNVGLALALSEYTIDAARAWLASVRPRDAAAQHAASKAWHGVDFLDGQWWH
jgi:hypothetical protein